METNALSAISMTIALLSQCWRDAKNFGCLAEDNSLWLPCAASAPLGSMATGADALWAPGV